MGSSSNSTEVAPPWLELPREITAMILQKLGTVEILTTAEKVCSAWRSVCHDAAMWQRIHIRGDVHRMFDLEKMCRDAVDRSQGRLIDISIEFFGSDDLLLYISQRSCGLRRLQLAFCHGMTDERVSEAIKNFPLLEELHLYYTLAGPAALATIESVGRHCPHLKSFALNRKWCTYTLADPEVILAVRNINFRPLFDREALAIAENMPGVRQLQLLGNKMTNEGVQAILDGCHGLESLDLGQCFYADLRGDLGRQCRQRIKHLRHPNDTTDDYEYYFEYYPDGDDDLDDMYGAGFDRDVDYISDEFGVGDD